MTYRCSECGRQDVEIAPEHPSLDSRWPLGWCYTCAPDTKESPDKWKLPKGRKLVPLVGHPDTWTS